MPVNAGWQWKAGEYPPMIGSSIYRSSPQEAFNARPTCSTTKSGGMWHFGPRLGIERCGKINSANSCSDNCTGIGVISGFLAVVVMICGPHVKKVDSHGSIQILPNTTRG